MAKISVQAVKQCRERYEAGDDLALLDAVDICIRSGTTVPVWAANAFSDRYLAWRSFQTKTLDDAFKVHRPKGAHLSTRARRQQLLPMVVREYRRLKDATPSIDLFEVIGKNLNIPAGTAKEYFYANDNIWRQFLDLKPPL